MDVANHLYFHCSLTPTSVKRHSENSFRTVNLLVLPAEDLHGATYLPVLFDFLPVTVDFPGFHAVCDLHSLLPQRQISPVVRQIEARPCHRRIPKVLGSFLSIHEASQVDSRHCNILVAAQSCWTPRLLASRADKPVWVLADLLITANSLFFFQTLSCWLNIFYFVEKRWSSRMVLYRRELHHREMRRSHCTTFLPPSTNRIQDLSSGPWLDCAGIQRRRCRLARGRYAVQEWDITLQ